MNDDSSDDEKVLQMLAGAHFGPDSKVILPSGRELEAPEAQALTSFYAPDAAPQTWGELYQKLQIHPAMMRRALLTVALLVVFAVAAVTVIVWRLVGA